MMKERRDELQVSRHELQVSLLLQSCEPDADEFVLADDNFRQAISDKVPMLISRTTPSMAVYPTAKSKSIQTLHCPTKRSGSSSGCERDVMTDTCIKHNMHTIVFEKKKKLMCCCCLFCFYRFEQFVFHPLLSFQVVYNYYCCHLPSSSSYYYCAV